VSQLLLHLRSTGSRLFALIVKVPTILPMIGVAAEYW
jgi:hypothetical protein